MGFPSSNRFASTLTQKRLRDVGHARIPANAFACNTDVINRSSSYIRILTRSFLEAIAPNATRINLLTFQKCVSEGAPTDLALVLRWGLGHLARREGKYNYRGLISWKVYEKWRRPDKCEFIPFLGGKKKEKESQF